MGARLQIYVKARSRRLRSGLFASDYLGVLDLLVLMKPLSHDPTVLDQDGAHRRIGRDAA
jgi:hypothetical protein